MSNLDRTLVCDLKNKINEEVCLKGWVYKIRRLSKISFIILRDRSGKVQCVVENSIIDFAKIKNESIICITGKVVNSNNAINSFEVQGNSIALISHVENEIPLEINSSNFNVNLDTILNNRSISLRQEKINSVFKFQAIIAQGFREFLVSQGFTEVFTPKIVAEGAEGGTAIFEVKYFENKAYLAQSPQFYKQMLVGAGYERVFEIGHAYRAEEHNTNRHLNEYISMDFEMGFIDSEKDVMKMEEQLLRYILNKLSKEANYILEDLQIDLPKIGDSIPAIKFKDALELLSKVYNKNDLEGDLDPESEKLLCKYAKEHLNSEFLFITHYPRKKRPMYIMPEEEQWTRSFDLLFRGLEITTGGQRINDYNMLVNNMKIKGLNPDKFQSYLEAFKYAMPPHGGLAIGLERLTAQLLHLNNVREASLFPRDRTRITP